MAKFPTGPEDFAQAEWLASRLGGQWRYDHSTEQWHHWDGVRWAVDKRKQILKIVAETAATGAVKASNDGERKALLKLLSVGPQGRALEALSTFDQYGTTGEDWDTDPTLLGCANGIVDLTKNSLVPATPEQKITRSTGVPFEAISGPADFQRVAPLFISKMLEWTSDYDWSEQPEMVSFLLLWFGAGLFGYAPEERFLLMTGRGRNGKGSIAASILAALGEDYSAEPDGNLYSRSAFGPARSSDARADLMHLRGKRITFFSEPDKGRFNEEMLKSHTGGDLITARHLYQKQPVSWAPTHSINFLVNKAPELDDLGPSMADRVMVVDFRHSWDGADMDPTLKERLRAERKGILSILCWAAKAWYDMREATGRGLELPERVIEQSKAFMERNDPLANWLRVGVQIGPGLTANSKLAHDAFSEWFVGEGTGEKPMSAVRFAADLSNKGFTKTRTAGGVVWSGFRLLSSAEMIDGDVDETED